MKRKQLIVVHKLRQILLSSSQINVHFKQLRFKLRVIPALITVCTRIIASIGDLKIASKHLQDGRFNVQNVMVYYSIFSNQYQMLLVPF